MESMTSKSGAMESLGTIGEAGEIRVSLDFPLSFGRLTGACIELSREEEDLDDEEEAEALAAA